MNKPTIYPVISREGLKLLLNNKMLTQQEMREQLIAVVDYAEGLTHQLATAVEDIKHPSVCERCVNDCQGDDVCIDNEYMHFEWRGTTLSTANEIKSQIVQVKPCPICGKELKIHGPENWMPSFYDPDSGGDPYSAQCDCGLHYSTGTYSYKEFVAALNRRAPLENKAPTTEPCWCKNCAHVTCEDGLNYVCSNTDSAHYNEAVRPHCTCEECVPCHCARKERIIHGT